MKKCMLCVWIDETFARLRICLVQSNTYNLVVSGFDFLYIYDFTMDFEFFYVLTYLRSLAQLIKIDQ